MALEQRIKQEIEENPALEMPESDDNHEEDDFGEMDDTPAGTEDEVETDDQEVANEDVAMESDESSSDESDDIPACQSSVPTRISK